jgi:hypothetical protein
MKRFIVAGVVLATVLMAGFQANATIADPPVVYYSFNNSSLLNGTTAGTNAFLGADTGSAISTFTYGSSFGPGAAPQQFFAGNLANAQPAFVAGNSASSNGSLGDANSYVQFTLNATGLSGIGVTWAAARSSSASNVGASTNRLEYSTDGGATFTIFSINSLVPQANNIWIAFTNDLSGVTALDGNASDVFRIYYGQAIVPSTGLQSTAGTERLDNLTVYGAIPEPSTVMLVGMGLFGLLAIRRRRA